jgi:hypothetical protein
MCFITLLHHFTIISENRFWIAIFAGHTIPFAYLIGPFLYFYTRNSLKGTTKMDRIDYIHYFPFIISLISIFPFYFVDFDSKLKLAQLFIDSPSNIIKINLSWLYPSYFNILLRPLFLLAYSITCLLLLTKFI